MFGKSVRLTCLKEKINRPILWNIRFLKSPNIVIDLKNPISGSYRHNILGGHRGTFKKSSALQEDPQ